MNFTEFIDTVNKLDKPRILELGTKRSRPDVPTTRKGRFKGYREYIMSDKEPGLDVDVIADVHRLSSTFGEQMWDVVLAFSVFEHLRYPQLAAHQIMNVLSVKGLVFIQTHQSFPLHGYPQDYCRFSADALAALFTVKMGVTVLEAWHEFPAVITSERDPGTKNGKAFLNSNLIGQKFEVTPKVYLYEL